MHAVYWPISSVPDFQFMYQISYVAHACCKITARFRYLSSKSNIKLSCFNNIPLLTIVISLEFPIPHRWRIISFAFYCYLYVYSIFINLYFGFHFKLYPHFYLPWFTSMPLLFSYHRLYLYFYPYLHLYFTFTLIYGAVYI